MMMCFELVKCICEQNEFVLEDFFTDNKIISNYNLFIQSQTQL